MRYFFANSLILNQIRLFCLFLPFSLFQQIRLLDFSALKKFLCSEMNKLYELCCLEAESPLCHFLSFRTRDNPIFCRPAKNEEVEKGWFCFERKDDATFIGRPHDQLLYVGFDSAVTHSLR